MRNTHTSLIALAATMLLGGVCLAQPQPTAPLPTPAPGITPLSRPPGFPPQVTPTASSPQVVPVTGLPGQPVVVPVAPTPGGPAPHIQFASTEHDFGRVSAGTVVRADFTFTNTGTAPLDITEVRPTCGCTAAGAWDRNVEPGKTGKIPLAVNTANFGGPVVKMITIVCNDPTQSTLFLQVKGTIWKPIDVTPTFVVFNVIGEPQTNETRSVKILNNTDAPLTLSAPQSGSPNFSAQIKTNTPGKDYDLIVSLVPPLNAQTAQSAINLQTSSTNMPVITITALAMVQQPIIVAPGQIFLPGGPLGMQMQIPLTIRNSMAAQMTLSEPTVNLANVTAQVTESVPGHVFNVLLTFPAGFQMPAGQTGQFTAKTSTTQMPLINVPIVQSAPATPIAIPAPPATLPPGTLPPGTSTPTATAPPPAPAPWTTIPGADVPAPTARQ